MDTAVVRSLAVHPVQSADLSFEHDGTIAYENEDGRSQLGTRVFRVDLNHLYSVLGTYDFDTGKLKFDSRTLEDHVQRLLVDIGGQDKIALFGTRTQELAAQLDRAIASRQNAYLKLYKHKGAFVAQMTALYDATNPDSKLRRLDSLASTLGQQYSELDSEYASSLDGVVKSVESTARGNNFNYATSNSTSFVDSNNTTEINSNSSGYADQTSEAVSFNDSRSDTSIFPFGQKTVGECPTRPLGEHDNESYKTELQHSRTYEVVNRGRHSGDFTYNSLAEIYPSISVPAKKKVREDDYDVWVVQDDWVSTQRIGTNGSGSISTSSGGTNSSTSYSAAIGTLTSFSTAIIDTTSDGKFASVTGTRGYEYRHPRAENEMRYHRQTLELQDEKLNHSIVAFQLESMTIGGNLILEQVLNNNLEKLDLEIRQLQLALIRRYLVAPISGVITAIFKDVGDGVRAYEPVLRIENDDEVFIRGVLNFRGRISLGQRAKVKTQSLFEEGRNLELNGRIVSIRGHDADNDEWTVVLRCENRVDPHDAGNFDRHLPLNYTFDRHDTVVELR